MLWLFCVNARYTSGLTLAIVHMYVTLTDATKHFLQTTVSKVTGASILGRNLIYALLMDVTKRSKHQETCRNTLELTQVTCILYAWHYTYRLPQKLMRIHTGSMHTYRYHCILINVLQIVVYTHSFWRQPHPKSGFFCRCRWLPGKLSNVINCVCQTQIDVVIQLLFHFVCSSFLTV